MIDFSNVQMEQLAIHRIGNKHRAEKNFISESLFVAQPELKEDLINYFLKPFKRAEDVYRFNTENNTVQDAAQSVFENRDKLLDASVELLLHLYRQSNHPNIKSGEVCIAYFANVLLDDELVNAVGIFKSEQKHSFFQFSNEENAVLIRKEEGISMEKLDKACLILSTEQEDGFRILSIDNNSYDTAYWHQHFLEVDFVKNENFHTRSYLELCEEFSKEVISEDGDRQEQRKFINDSVQYFAANDTFDFNEFAETVVKDDQLVEELRTYRQDFALEEVDGFEISKKEAKKAKKKMKTNINLDTKISIRIGGDDPETQAQYIERGFDEEKGMNFYKVFFNEEI